jgi:hypothetical protein
MARALRSVNPTRHEIVCLGILPEPLIARPPFRRCGWVPHKPPDYEAKVSLGRMAGWGVGAVAAGGAGEAGRGGGARRREAGARVTGG